MQSRPHPSSPTCRAHQTQKMRHFSRSSRAGEKSPPDARIFCACFVGDYLVLFAIFDPGAAKAPEVLMGTGHRRGLQSLQIPAANKGSKTSSISSLAGGSLERPGAAAPARPPGLIFCSFRAALQRAAFPHHQERSCTKSKSTDMFSRISRFLADSPRGPVNFHFWVVGAARWLMTSAIRLLLR